MYSKFELLYLIKIIDEQESGLVALIEYYTKTHIFKNKKELKDSILQWFNDDTRCERTFGHIKDWDVSRITNMDYLFNYEDDVLLCNYTINFYNFNDDISKWDVSNVISMKNLFEDNKHKVFNNSLKHWDTSKVTNIDYIYQYYYMLTTTEFMYLLFISLFSWMIIIIISYNFGIPMIK